MLHELSGTEFDWFASDSEGNLALFATAGEGFLPQTVREHHASHADVSDSIEAPRTGTVGVWLDYAEAGLYVFDWRLPGGPYQQQAAPTSPMHQALKARIHAIPKLPCLPASFAALMDIECSRLG